VQDVISLSEFTRVNSYGAQLKITMKASALKITIISGEHPKFIQAGVADVSSASFEGSSGSGVCTAGFRPSSHWRLWLLVQMVLAISPADSYRLRRSAPL
jgi:hypothetical protein